MSRARLALFSHRAYTPIYSCTLTRKRTATATATAARALQTRADTYRERRNGASPTIDIVNRPPSLDCLIGSHYVDAIIIIQGFFRGARARCRRAEYRCRATARFHCYARERFRLCPLLLSLAPVSRDCRGIAPDTAASPPNRFTDRSAVTPAPPPNSFLRYRNIRIGGVSPVRYHRFHQLFRNCGRSEIVRVGNDLKASILFFRPRVKSD